MAHIKSAEREVARRSALTCTALSLAAAAMFFTVATLQGGHPEVAHWGGAAWVFLLSMIVSMPLVTARYQKRARRRPPGR
jgi:O-antigen/teichoic acid export membrane protein